MYYVNYHCHSDCSPDADYPMAAMVQAAVDRGINELCFTDHCDFEWYETGEFDENYFILHKVREEFLKTEPLYRDKIKLKMGVEVACMNRYPQLMPEILEYPGLDFIIGSIHNLGGMSDLGLQNYTDVDMCQRILGMYLDEYIEIAEMDMYDVIGHIGYPLRYMANAGIRTDLSGYYDKLRELFRIVIENGKGIELNTSGLRQSLGITMPSPDIVKLYKECGGEIITIGTDSHFPEHVDANLKDGYEILKDAGFKYITVYSGRKPEFIKI